LLSAKRLPHQTYSLDLAPNDFLLFGSLKERLTQFNCTSRRELKNAVTAIFNEIHEGVLFAVFESWIKRVKWVIKHHEDCSNKGTRNKTGFLQVRRPRDRNWEVSGNLGLEHQLNQVPFIIMGQ
jgi:hypothetical protein